MAEETSVKTSQWRQVQVGRVVLLNSGPFAGKLAAIVEIIDHKRVLIDGPKTGVSRQQYPLKNLTLTPITIENLPRGGRATAVAKAWEKDEVESKWSGSTWAQKIATRERRGELSDFERFKVLVLKKQRRYEVRKAVAKGRAAAKA